MSDLHATATANTVLTSPASSGASGDDAAGVAETRSRDADRSQQIILEAATREFSEHGLGGARMDRIAERAQVNKRLIYYYFGNKESLFLAVLEQAYVQIREAETRLQLTDLPPIEAVRQLTRFTWNYFVEHPEFMALLNVENLQGAQHLRRSSRVQQTNFSLIQILEQVLARGQAQGIFRAGVDAMQLYISIAGISYFYLSNHATLSTIFDRELMSPSAREARLMHVTDVILGYLRNDS